MASPSSVVGPLASRPLILARPRASASPADPVEKVYPSPSESFPLARRTDGDPKRPWWAPLPLSVPRRAGSEGRKSAEGRSKDAEGTGRREKGSGRTRSMLTAEKAKVLRREMRATQTWHDAMYHSAIASRLASPDEH